MYFGVQSMRRKLAWVWGAVLFTVILSRTATAVSVNDFADFSWRDSAGKVLLPGRLYVPPEAANRSSPRPFITYLHGGALAGTDNLLQLTGVNDHLLAEAKARGAFLYVPQSPNTWGSLAIVDEVKAMVDRAVAELNADSHRLYASGHSNGGGGVWNLLSRYPGEFAAAIPISAVSPAPGFVAGNLVDTPIWAIHGRVDTVVPVGVTRGVVGSILLADQQPLPNYQGLSSNVDLLISNPQLELHRSLTAQAHQQRPIVDFFVTDPDLDLLYFEGFDGGHDTLGILSVPLLYDWMFAHSTVPEPSSAAMMASILVAASSRRCRKIV
jgi:hypothetical protein